MTCPACSTLYHEDHLSMWLSIKNTCPNCRDVIPYISKFPEISAETKQRFEHRRRLYRIANSGEIIDENTITGSNLYQKPKRMMSYEEQMQERPAAKDPSPPSFSLFFSTLLNDIRNWFSKPRKEKLSDFRKFIGLAFILGILIYYIVILLLIGDDYF